jgi:peptide/nickel transport system substrate-binding protein
MKRLLLLCLLLAGPARAETVLRYAPLGDLRILDPIWTSAAITLSHGQMIYDVLVTTDSKLVPKLQMAESVATSADGLRWTFKLRPGLVFHDGQKVTARDVIASLSRWGKRVTAGQALFARVASLNAIDDRTIELVLARPFGPVLEALSSPVLAPFVMREADATTDAFKQVTTTVGSGPFAFVASEFQAGHKVVYRKFPGYVPRQEPADFYSGGKVVKVDRVEWLYLPDPATAMGALQTGEVDIVASVSPDFLPVLRARKDVVVQVLDQIGQIGTIRPNAAHLPFSDKRARQALTLLVDQPEFAEALAGSPEFGRECFAVFVCGTPYETDFGAAKWKKPNIALARKLLAEAGYHGEKLVLLDPADQPDIHIMALLTADALRKAGVAVDVQTMDWSTVLTRRNNRDLPSVNPAGWDIAFTFWGGLSLSSPLTNAPLVSSCDGKNLYGWPCDPEIERLRAAFTDATDVAARKSVIEAMQVQFYESAPYISTGLFFRPIAYRANLRGLLTTPYPVMWNVERTGP